MRSVCRTAKITEIFAIGDHQKDGTKMNDKKCCAHIKGVVCDVKNCAYHDGETRCTAGEITVGPTYASTSHDTACATFKPNTDKKQG